VKKKQSIAYGGVGKNGKTFVSADFGYVGVVSLTDPKPLNRKSRRAIVHEYRSLEKESNEELLELDAKKKIAAKERRKKVKAAGYLRRRANNLRK